MIRILFYLVAVFAIAAGVSWIADRPGTVSLDWLGYTIETNVTVALVALIVLVVVVMLVWWLVGLLFRGPTGFRRVLVRRRRERGRNALSRGLVAVGAGDVKLARRYMTEARRYLPHDPATHLLAAQTAQLGGDRAAARLAFEGMLKNSETRLLGLHGLHVEALREGEAAAAHHYAEEAVKEAANLPWAARAVFAHAAATGDWERAAHLLTRNGHNGLVDKPESRRLRAVLLTARALEIENGEPEKARTLALEAHGLAPDLVPAGAVAGRLVARLGDVRRATKVLETTWRKSPHPEIAEAYAAVRSGDAARDRLKRMRALAALQPHEIEGDIALARAAIEAREFAEARGLLKGVLERQPSRRACLLMADLEEAEKGDMGRVREWLGRAVRAPADPAWTADGVTSEHWAPVSPVTGRLDAFEWKTPVAALGDAPALVIEDSAFEARPPLPPKPAIIEPPLTPAPAGVGTVGTGAPPPGAATAAEAPTAASGVGPATSAAASASAASPKPASRATPAPLDPGYKPDDPGPDLPDEDAVAAAGTPRR